MLNSVPYGMVSALVINTQQHNSEVAMRFRRNDNDGLSSRFVKAFGVLGAVGMIGVLAAGCGSGKADETATTDSTAAHSSVMATDAAAESPAQRGEYLVTISGCNDCHTPLKMGPNGPEPDMSRMLSGHPENMPMPPAPKMDMPWMAAGAATMTAWTGPWGTSYTMNLTPDSVTGIGSWTEDIFIKTLRTGKHWGTSRPIMPPMPWQNIARMKDEDLKAMYAYLRSIPAIKNKVPDYQPPAGGDHAMGGGADTTQHM
jgi:mono/diheme cytochrome c family protein